MGWLASEPGPRCRAEVHHQLGPALPAREPTREAQAPPVPCRTFTVVLRMGPHTSLATKLGVVAGIVGPGADGGRYLPQVCADPG